MQTFLIGELVQLDNLSAIDYCGDDFGVSDDEFDDMLEAQARGDVFVVLDNSAGDGYDCLVELKGAAWQIAIRPHHLRCAG